jgi:hypothetical protein
VRPDLVRMNACVCGAAPGEPCRGRGPRFRRTHHSQRVALARFVASLERNRSYHDAMTTPGLWTFPERRLSDGTLIERMAGRLLVSSPPCEHCDGERSRWVRTDPLRGQVCPLCDDALDAMFEGEPPLTAAEADLEALP